MIEMMNSIVVAYNAFKADIAYSYREITIEWFMATICMYIYINRVVSIIEEKYE